MAGGIVAGISVAKSLYNDFKNDDENKWWKAGGAAGGAALGGYIGAHFFGIGAIPGALIGGAIGAWGGYEGTSAIVDESPEEKIKKELSKLQNDPAYAQDYSQYNTAYNSQSTESSPTPEVTQTQHNVVSLNGIDTLKSLLRDINSNTKAVVTELRNSGMRPGTNLAT